MAGTRRPLGAREACFWMCRLVAWGPLSPCKAPALHSGSWLTLTTHFRLNVVWLYSNCDQRPRKHCSGETLRAHSCGEITGPQARVTPWVTQPWTRWPRTPALGPPRWRTPAAESSLLFRVFLKKSWLGRSH